MKLSPRLKAIAGLVDKNSIVADIGTDHGYIPVYLVENNISNKVIASDINEGPLESAISYVKKKKLTDNIELRLGNGIKTINEFEVDTCIIAGMGGILISEILESSKGIARTIEKFILQPMVASYELRKYLYENNYKIAKETLAKENERYYKILLVEHGKDSLEDDIYLEVGKKIIEEKHFLFVDFLDKKIKKYNIILENIKTNSSIINNEKYDEIVTKIEKLKDVKRKYES